MLYRSHTSDTLLTEIGISEAGNLSDLHLLLLEPGHQVSKAMLREEFLLLPVPGPGEGRDNARQRRARILRSPTMVETALSILRADRNILSFPVISSQTMWQYLLDFYIRSLIDMRINVYANI